MGYTYIYLYATFPYLLYYKLCEFHMCALHHIWKSEFHFSSQHTSQKIRGIKVLLLY